MKTIFAFLSVILFASIGYGQIKVLEKIPVHNPIIISSLTSADVYIWKLDSTTLMMQAVPDSKTIHVWAAVGKHNIRLVTVVVDIKIPTTYKPGDKLEKDIKYNEYIGEFEVTGTNPIPVPVPVPVPVPTNDFKEQIKVAMSKVTGMGLQSKANVGKIYADIAKEADTKPGSWDAATMVNEVKVRSASTLSIQVLKDWKDFWPATTIAFKDLKLAATDLQGHIKAFKEVAEVLIQ